MDISKEFSPSGSALSDVEMTCKMYNKLECTKGLTDHFRLTSN